MRITTGILAFSLILIGCNGDDSGSESETSTSTNPTTTEGTTEDPTTEGTTDATTDGTTDPTTSTTTPETTTSTTDDTATTDDTTTTGVVELTCESYCAIYFDACDDFTQFDNEASCLAQCSQWPEGTIDDTGQDSLGCRIYHATVAKTDDPVLHCPHAGKNGDGVCVDDGAPDCANYCTVYSTNCTGELNVYADEADCLSACSVWYQGSEDDVEGDTVGCRTYHASVAFGDPELHCPHASPGGGGICTL